MKTTKTIKYGFAGLSIIGIIIISVALFPTPPASLQNNDLADFNWNSWSEGDLFYYFVGDSYSNINQSKSYRDYGALLKSEIIKIGDLSVDNDALDDLTFMSSALIGDERIGFEVPILFDLYQIFAIVSMISGEESYDPYEKEYFRLFAEPSSIHVALSSFYMSLVELAEKFPDPESLVTGAIAGPTDVFFTGELGFAELAAQLSAFIFADYTFTNEPIGLMPKDFIWDALDKDNNFAGVVETLYSKFMNMLRISQNGEQSSNQSVTWDYFIKNLYEKHGETEKLNYHYYSTTKSYDFQFQFDNGTSRETIIEMGQDYNHEVETDVWIEGFNGLKLKFDDDGLSYINGTFYFEDNLLINSSTNTFEDNRIFNWVDLQDDFNFSQPVRYITSVGPQTFNLTLIQLNDGQINNYTYTGLKYYITAEDTALIKYASDDFIDGFNTGYFTALNFHKLRINQPSTNPEGFDLFDDYTFSTLNIIDQHTQRVLSADNLILKTLGLGISFYHFLLLPENFQMSVISKMVDFLNYAMESLFESLEALPDYDDLIESYNENLIKASYSSDDFEIPSPVFLIEETNTTISVSIDDRIWVFVITLIEDMMLGSNLRFITGRQKLGFKMEWDLTAMMFKELNIYTIMPEIDVRRDISIKLVCTSRLNDGIPTKIPSHYGIINEDKVLLLVDDYFDVILDYIWQQNKLAIVGLFSLFIAVPCGAAVGIVYLIRKKLT